MARYYFHVDNGEHIDDEVGTELSGLTEARECAAKLICEKLAGGTAHIWPSGGLCVTITDADRLILAILEISASTTLSPAVGPAIRPVL